MISFVYHTYLYKCEEFCVAKMSVTPHSHDIDIIAMALSNGITNCMYNCNNTNYIFISLLYRIHRGLISVITYSPGRMGCAGHWWFLYWMIYLFIPLLTQLQGYYWHYSHLEFGMLLCVTHSSSQSNEHCSAEPVCKLFHITLVS